MEKKIQLPDDITAEFLVTTAYLDASTRGYKLISLDDKELKEVIDRVETVLYQFGFGEETFKLCEWNKITGEYGNYKLNLLHSICATGLGILDEETNSIVIDCPVFEVFRGKTWAFKYERVIDELAYAISQDKTIIGERSCQNCGYRCYVIANGGPEVLTCEKHGSDVEEDYYCPHHAFFGDECTDELIKAGYFEQEDYDARIGELESISYDRELKRYQKKSRN